MAERSSRKRSNSLESEQQVIKKPKISRRLCSLKTCSNPEICEQTDSYVEIKGVLPEAGVERFKREAVIKWGPTGDAQFHKECWEKILKSCRARNPKNILIKTSPSEKAIVKESAKTVEFHDSNDTVEREAEKIADLIAHSRHCIVFTGAGISTSAGIGDYRGKEGKWTEEDREVSTQEEGVPYERLRPTYTHEALAKLVEMGLIKHIISQNGDGLHGLSGVPSDKLSELHGNVFIEICIKCGFRYNRPFYVMDDNCSQYYEDVNERGCSDFPKPPYAIKCDLCELSHSTGRKCEQKGCKGFLKDSIINFGDDLEEYILRRAEENADKADLCISLGTTMQVTPACDLVTRGKRPLRLVIVNRQITGFDDLCLKKSIGKALGSRVFGDCDQLMAEIMKHLLLGEQLGDWESGLPEKLKQYDQLRVVEQL